MTVVELDTPPAEPVEWVVSKTYTAEVASYTVDGVTTVFDPPYPTATWDESETVTARTAFDAHRQVCSRLPGSPPFGSCRVRRCP